MKSLLLILALAIGLCVIGYFDHQRRSANAEQSASTIGELANVQEQLGLSERNLNQAKTDLQAANDKLTAIDADRKKEVADMQAKLDESMKQAAAAPTEESKKQMPDVEEIKTKLTAAETKLTATEAELAKAKAETAAAKAQATTAQAEVQRLQQLTARPPLGGVRR